MSAAVVIQTAFLGDAVLSIPLIGRVAAKHGSVDVVTTPGSAEIVETVPGVRSVLTYDKRGTDRGWTGLRYTADRLRGLGHHTAYLPHPSIRTALLARSAGIPDRVGFAHGSGRFWYTRRVTPRGTYQYQRLESLVGRPGESPPRLRLTEEDHALAQEALEGVARPFAVIAPGSVWPTKRWPRYPELAKRLLEHFDVVVIGGREDGIWNVLETPPGVLDLTGRLPVRASAAVIERARVAVTNDSAPMHLAAAVGTPVTAVFGPTHPRQGFLPPGPTRAVQIEGLHCRPCSAHGGRHCPLGHHRCMLDLGVDQVLWNVLEMAERTQGVTWN